MQRPRACFTRICRVAGNKYLNNDLACSRFSSCRFLVRFLARLHLQLLCSCARQTRAKSTRPERWMTYVVTEACIKCKYTDCVEVCPVDCFYEGENMLVIHPDECIDCGVC